MATKPTHIAILQAASIVYSNRDVRIEEFDSAQRVLKTARQYGYRFNVYGAVISFTPEQMAVFVACDQIWESMQAHGRPDFVGPVHAYAR